MTDKISKLLPTMSLGIVRNDTGQTAETITGLRYLGVETQGHAIVGVIINDAGKSVSVKTYLTDDHLSDIKASLQKVEWHVTDVDLTLIEIIDLLPIINAGLKNLETDITITLDSDRRIDYLTITQVKRGSTSHQFDITLTANVFYKSFSPDDSLLFPVTLTIEDVHGHPFLLEGDLNDLSTLIGTYVSQHSSEWTIDQPATLTIEEFVSNQWWTVTGDWYINNQKFASIDLTSFKDDVDRPFYLGHVYPMDFEGNVDTTSQIAKFYVDDLVFSDRDHCRAVWFNHPDRKTEYATQRYQSEKLNVQLTEIKAGRDDLEKHLNEALEMVNNQRSTLKEEVDPEQIKLHLFTILDNFDKLKTLDDQITLMSEELKSLNVMVKLYEVGIKNGACYLWELNGRPDNRQSDDKVTTVAVRPNLNIISDKLAYLWAIKNEAKDLVVESIDRLKALDRVKAGMAIPSGTELTETIYATIKSAPLYDNYLADDDSDNADD